MVSAQSETRQILFVEDDQDTVDLISNLLTEKGFGVHCVSSGDRAVQYALSQSPNLILLDLKLPDISGLEVLKKIRRQSFIPIIVLSGNRQQHVSALEIGADDFLTKPFSTDELVARIRALLRRVEWTPEPQTMLRVRDLELDLPRRQANISGERLHLTPIEYGLLSTLMSKAGGPVSHNELLLSVWGDTYKGDYSVLRVNISRLRHKLEQNARKPKYIVTVAGEGYTMPLD